MRKACDFGHCELVGKTYDSGYYEFVRKTYYVGYLRYYELMTFDWGTMS